jgi:hypothetical protein
MTVLRVRAESGRAERKRAECHSAEPNVKLSTLHSVKMSNCQCYKTPNVNTRTDKLSKISNYPHPIGLLFLVTIIPLGAYLFMLGALHKYSP